MQKVHIELIGDVSIYLGLGIEIVTAFVLGGLIGYDREKKMKAAGIKVTTPDPAQFQKAVQPVWDKYESTFGKDLMDLVRKYAS